MIPAHFQDHPLLNLNLLVHLYEEAEPIAQVFQNVGLILIVNECMFFLYLTTFNADWAIVVPAYFDAFFVKLIQFLDFCLDWPDLDGSFALGREVIPSPISLANLALLNGIKVTALFKVLIILGEATINPC